MGCGSSTTVNTVKVQDDRNLPTVTQNSNEHQCTQENQNATEDKQIGQNTKSQTHIQDKQTQSDIPETNVDKHDKSGAKPVDNTSSKSGTKTSNHEFPDPRKVEILDAIPLVDDSPFRVKLEDTFWEGKKRLIPDYAVMLMIDQHVMKAPQSLKNDPHKLIDYLLKPTKNEVQRVRALVRWIGENIAYDVKSYREGGADCSVEGILRNGRAICEGYATLLSHLCQICGIKCEKVSGMTKGYASTWEVRVTDKSDHAWNRINIDGEWYFVDSTWCSGSVGETFTKCWDECWFLTDPEAFVFKHLPMTDKEISPELQMIKNPYTSIELWDLIVERAPASFTYGMEPQNFLNSRINTKEDELNFKYTCSKSLNHYISFEKEEKNAPNTKLDNNWGIIYTENGIVKVHIRFPKPGRYILKLCAVPEIGDDLVKTSFTAFLYRINYQGKSCTKFSSGGHLWGEQPTFLAAGFKVIAPASTVIHAKKGYAVVKVKLPSSGYVNNLYDFTSSTCSGEINKLDEYVYAEKDEGQINYYVQCPSAGEYRLEIYSKCIDNSYVRAAFLIISKDVNPKAMLNKTVIREAAGPDSSFYKMGLTTNSRSSTIKFKNDIGSLHIKKTKSPIFLLSSLKCIDDDSTTAKGLLTKEENENECIITIKKPDCPGYYWIQLFASEKQYGASYNYVGTFCVPYQVPIME